jgi:hypothetical protein
MSKLEQKKYNIDFVESEEQFNSEKLYIIRKIVDNYNGFHPNGIDEGYTIIGKFENPPTVGERFIIKGVKFSSYLNTSTVTEIVSDTIFKTLNSTYELKEYSG